MNQVTDPLTLGGVNQINSQILRSQMANIACTNSLLNILGRTDSDIKSTDLKILTQPKTKSLTANWSIEVLAC